MKREEKNEIIELLKEQINQSTNFYLADISNLNAENTSKLRRACFGADIKMTVVKNTLLKKAFELSDKKVEEIFPVLKNNTSIMFCESANAPAILIKEFRKQGDRPILKGAYVQECVYVGDNQLDALVNIKSKEQLIGDIILTLKSPMNNLLSQLNSGKHIIGGLVKTLSERE